LDLYSRKAIGYALSTNVDTALTLSALNMAITERTSYDSCIHHSDRGVQYASREYVNILRANNLLISMSSKGNPYENAAAESFMKTLKCEEVYLKEYHTINDVVTNIIPFIRDVYNAKRLHSSLGYQSPDEFELTCLHDHSNFGAMHPKPAPLAAAGLAGRNNYKDNS
jgi:putative transposase